MTEAVSIVVSGIILGLIIEAIVVSGIILGLIIEAIAEPIAGIVRAWKRKG